MSEPADYTMPLSFTRPTREGTRRRPRSRRMDVKRPPSAYRQAMQLAFARMAFIERLRETRFAQLAYTVDEQLAAISQSPPE